MPRWRGWQQAVRLSAPDKKQGRDGRPVPAERKAHVRGFIALSLVCLWAGLAGATSVNFDLLGGIDANPADDIYVIDLYATFSNDFTGSGRVALEYNQGYSTLQGVTLDQADSYDPTPVTFMSFNLWRGGLNVNVTNRTFLADTPTRLASIELQTSTYGTYFYVRDDTPSYLWFKRRKEMETVFPGVSLIDNDAFDSHGTPNVDAAMIMDAPQPPPAPAVVPEPMTMLALGSSLAGLGGYLRRRRRA